MSSTAGEDHALASMETIHTSELYPMKPLVQDDPDLQIPFPVLCGENVTHLGKTSDGLIALSDYRLFIRFKDTFVNIALGLIESVEYRDIFYLHIYCKDAHSLRCTFCTNEMCIVWYKRLCQALERPEKLQNVFAFAFHARCVDSMAKCEGSTELMPGTQLCMPDDTFQGYSFSREVERMGFDLKVEKAWRISYVNEDYKACPTYPKEHIVPSCITDDGVLDPASFRACRRFPSVVWRDTRSGAVIIRCSQPEVGWLGWRNTHDEKLLQAISSACAVNTAAAEPHAAESSSAEIPVKKMLIIDARSYAAAVANRAKGGGCECIEYYPNSEIRFMSLANIHSIRKSFQAVRNLCTQAFDQPGWLTAIDSTKWLQHIVGLLRTAVIVVDAIDCDQRPVLVHCSDGWDRTPQIVALAELLLDPYYRTIEGFRVLVEREWLAFGHKFADRCGQSLCSDDTNERCPVFVQWLDCIHQLLLQSPCAFQFNEAFLVKLAQHTYSCLFGTFLCNCEREREEMRVRQTTCSVWSLLHPNNKKFVNLLYKPASEPVLRPSCHLQHVQLWSAVYLSETAPTAALEDLAEESDHTPEDTTLADQASDPAHLPKTRSCENLLLATENSADHVGAVTGRRSSDPNIKTDANQLLKSMPNLQSKDDECEAVANGHLESEETESQSDPNCSTTKEADTLTASTEHTESSNGSEAAESPSSDASALCNGHERPLVNGNGNECDAACDNAEEAEASSDNTNIDNNDEKDSEGDITTPRPLCNGNGYLLNGHTEGSTDTLVEHPMLDDTEIAECKNASTDTSRASTDSVPTINVEQSIILKRRSWPPPFPEKLSHISTSTSDISDSHVGRQIPSGVWLDEALLSLNLSGPRSCTYNGRLAAVGAAGSDVQTACSGKASSASGESDTCVSQFSHSTPCSTNPPTPGMDMKTCPWVKRQTSGLGRHLDCDGLITYSDPVQKRMSQIESEYQCHIQQLRTQLMNAKQLIYQYASGRNGAGRHFDHKDDTLSNESADSNEYNSMGGGSTAASDVSWEQIEEHDAPLTRWVPDHAVTHCGACEQKFGMMWRRHHCRNCGNVFCAECANYYTPLPQQHLPGPERVCRRCFHNLETTPCLWDTNDGSQETLVAKG